MRTLLLFALTISLNCLAEPANQPLSDKQLFIKALVDGDSYLPLSTLNKGFHQTEDMFKKNAGDLGDIYVHAWRLYKFNEQPNCGRIKFNLTQLTTQKVWPVGGELNICPDGFPPKKICTDKPGVLISADQKCSNGQPPQDTQEVREAINDAYKRGELSRQQVIDRMKAEYSKRKATNDQNR